MLTPDDIERRKPVWMTLSALWLDTELREEDLRAMAGVLRESGYSTTALYEVYLYEVAPAVYKNLLSPAGAWAGFDPDWLCAEAERHARRRSAARERMVRLKKGVMTYATEKDWKRLLQLLQAP